MNMALDDTVEKSMEKEKTRTKVVRRIKKVFLLGTLASLLYSVPLEAKKPAEQIYVSEDNQVEFITNKNKKKIYDGIRNKIIGYLRKNTSSETTRGTVVKLLSEKNIQKKLLVVPGNHKGISLCYDANRDRLCDSDELRFVNPTNESIFFTNAGRIFNSRKNLEQFLTKHLPQHSHIISAGLLGAYDLKSDLSFPGVSISYDYTFGNGFTLGGNIQFWYKKKDSLSYPTSIDPNQGTILKVTKKRNLEDCVFGLGFNFGHFKGSQGLIFNVGYQLSFQKTFSSLLGYELQNLYGDVLETGRYDTTSLEYSEVKHYLALGLKVPFRIVGRLVVSPYVGLQTDLQQTNLVFGAMVGKYYGDLSRFRIREQVRRPGRSWKAYLLNKFLTDKKDTLTFTGLGLEYQTNGQLAVEVTGGHLYYDRERRYSSSSDVISRTEMIDDFNSTYRRISERDVTHIYDTHDAGFVGVGISYSFLKWLRFKGGVDFVFRNKDIHENHVKTTVLERAGQPLGEPATIVTPSRSSEADFSVLPHGGLEACLRFKSLEFCLGLETGYSFDLKKMIYGAGLSSGLRF